MLVTVTNTSGRVLNALETITGGVGLCALSAVGGNRKDPLPYPFGHISLAIGANAVLPMNSRDLAYKRVPWVTTAPSDEWQLMVQAKLVTFAVAAEAVGINVSDLFIHEI